MKYIIGGRGVGKTYRAIAWLREDSTRIMLTTTEIQRVYLSELYPDVGAQIVSTRNRRSSSSASEVAINDLDLLLREMFGRVKLVTSFGTAEVLQPQDNPKLEKGQVMEETIRVYTGEGARTYQSVDDWRIVNESLHLNSRGKTIACFAPGCWHHFEFEIPKLQDNPA